MLSLQSPKCFWSRYRRISLAVFISTFLLSIPLIAMQFTTEVNWGIGDFAVFGFMLFIFSFIYFQLSKNKRFEHHHWHLLLFIILAFLYCWAELAVGVLF